MKLLSLRVCEHDANFTYFDGKNIHYYKTERFYQVKHHAPYLEDWEKELEQWDITSEDLDEIVVIFDPWYHYDQWEIETFFPSLENYELFPAKTKVTRLNHHYAHALSYWPISDKPDVCISIDGFGDLEKAWSVIRNDELIVEGNTTNDGSIGIEMSGVGSELNIKANHIYDLAGKVMGLQSYGKFDREFKKVLSKYNIHNVTEIFNLKHWFKYKGDNTVAELTKLDWIRTVHEHVGDILVEFFEEHCEKDEKIFYSGGVAQNVIWNTKLKRKFPNLVIPPHCTDEGLSLGGIEYLRRKYNLPEFKLDNFPYAQSDQAPKTKPSKETIKKVAQYLADGKIVGWYQGNGEIGPRALGNRSVLFNPTIENARDIINKVKKRENYRPFGASVLTEHKDKYFWDLGFESPYMLYVFNVKNSRGHNFNLESITHIDGTCRIQTVGDENPIYRELLEEFYNITGYPILLNTSLNIAGKPIMGNIKDTTSVDLDIMVVGDNIKIVNTIPRYP